MPEVLCTNPVSAQLSSQICFLLFAILAMRRMAFSKNIPFNQKSRLKLDEMDIVETQGLSHS
jgi:hypothetical protein